MLRLCQKRHMSLLSPSWILGIRHALVAMAVLATVVSTFGFHLHVGETQGYGVHSFVLVEDCAGNHDCSAAKLSCEQTANEVGEGDTNAVPHECCHYQASLTNLPTHVVEITSADHLVGLLTPRDEVVRVGVTYQPDPPPVLG